MDAKRKPRKEARQELASAILLKPSVTMAIEPLTIPAKNFMTKSKILNAIPTMLQRLAYACFTSGEFISI